jgi:hypothetical protein
VRGNRASSSDELDDVFVAGSFETSAASRLAAHIVGNEVACANYASQPVPVAVSNKFLITFY